jgi:hypothetical protein
MMRFDFDIREGGLMVPDGEGVVLPDMEAVQREATQSLIEIARMRSRSTMRTGRSNWQLKLEPMTDRSYKPKWFSKWSEDDRPP